MGAFLYFHNNYFRYNSDFYKIKNMGFSTIATLHTRRLGNYSICLSQQTFIATRVSSTYISFVSLNFGACYITGQWGRVQSKKCHFKFTYAAGFAVVVVVVFHEKLCFYHSHFSFLWSIRFPQQNINQTETRIGDKKLSVELYDHICYEN